MGQTETPFAIAHKLIIEKQVFTVQVYYNVVAYLKKLRNKYDQTS